MKTSPRLDFERLFESLHDPCLVLNPEIIIIAVNDANLQATMTKRVEILGLYLFDVFPDDPKATGVRNHHASLLCLH